MSYQQKLEVLDLIIGTMRLQEKALDRMLHRLEGLAILQESNAAKFADLIDELREAIEEVKK